MTALKKDLKKLINEFDDLSIKWAQVTWKQTPDPIATLTKGIIRSHGDIYWDSKLLDLRNQGNLREFVQKLFKRFIAFGFRYDPSVLVGTQFLGTDDEAHKAGFMKNPATLERYGSCATLANNFAKLLERFGITASAEWVVKQHRTFICKVAHFIDPAVHGNLEIEGAPRIGYFVFTGHAATRIKGLPELYDPMAKTWYLRPQIECYLRDRQDGSNELELENPCKTLNASSREFYVKPDRTRRVGGLACYKLKRKQG